MSSLPSNLEEEESRDDPATRGRIVAMTTGENHHEDGTSAAPADDAAAAAAAAAAEAEAALLDDGGAGATLSAGGGRVVQEGGSSSVTERAHNNLPEDPEPPPRAFPRTGAPASYDVEALPGDRSSSSPMVPPERPLGTSTTAADTEQQLRAAPPSGASEEQHDPTTSREGVEGGGIGVATTIVPVAEEEASSLAGDSSKSRPSDQVPRPTTEEPAVAAEATKNPPVAARPAHGAAPPSSTAASACPRRSAGSGGQCAVGEKDGHCPSCSSLLRLCSASRVSLEARLEQLLLSPNRAGTDDSAQPPPPPQRTSHPNNNNSVKADIRVNAAHDPRYSAIMEAVSKRNAEENQKHRVGLKGLLRVLKDEQRRALSERTGVSLESVHLMTKPKLASAKTSPNDKDKGTPPHGTDDNNDEAVAVVRGSRLATGSALAEQPPMSAVAQQWRDETQKAMGRYLAQKAIEEKGRHAKERAEVKGMREHAESRSEPAIPILFQEKDAAPTQQTEPARQSATALGNLAQTSVRPKASGPIKKRKDPTLAKEEMATKKARAAAAVLPPKRLTPLERLERETVDMHRRDLPPGSEDVVLRSFALEYNEWSVLAVARWVNNVPSSNDNGNAPSSLPRRRLIPTSPLRCRKCNVCGEMGHFEVVCPRMSPTTSTTLRAELDTLAATFEKAEPVEQRVTELCEGYAIEQSDKPFDDSTQNSRRRRLPTQVCVTELDRMVILSAPTPDLLLDYA